MNVKNKQSIKMPLFRLTLFNFITLFILLISTYSQSNQVLFNSTYYLSSQSDNIFIPINQSALNITNNGVIKFLKVQVKIQILNSVGTYVDSPFQTGNILVKYWKNYQNTQASSVLTYSYDKISATKQFPTSLDPNDNGAVDIESLYNYENDHNFFHIMGKQASDVLFVLAVYRFVDSGLTDILGMSTKNDQIKITVTVIKGPQSDPRCQFCSSKTFCPTNQCLCSQQLYSGCNVTKKIISTNIGNATKLNDKGSINKGQIQYIQIVPQSTQKDWFPVQLSFTLSNSNSSRTDAPQKDKIFLLMYLDNKNDTVEKIPNVYNFDFIDSPSLTGRIISQATTESSLVSESNLVVNVGTDQNSISMNEKILLSNNEFITAAIYYLNDTQSSTTQNANTLSVSMNINFSNVQNQETQSNTSINLALVIGMIVLGIFVLILLICLLHFLVSKRFNFMSVFSQMENSNRNSVNTARLSRNQNLQDRKLSLPTVSFNFLQDLVFKPLKYLYESNLQQNYSLESSMKKMIDENEICSICLEQFTNQSKVKYTYCGHILDSKCLDSWLEKQMSCPMCRQKLQPRDIAQYEDRILEQIVQNDNYQSIIDEEAQVLKNLYKTWRNNRNKTKNLIENTEQSLVNNQQTVSNKFIQNTMIPNISTMVQLQRTDINLKESINKRKQENSSLVLLKTQNNLNLNNVFINNQLFSVKRLGKIYLFYRCIYLHHKINKNFDKNSDINLFQSDLQVEKDHSIICESKRQHMKEYENITNHVNILQTKPCIIKTSHQIEEPTELYLNSAIKINQQIQNQQVKKIIQPQFSLYFDSDNLSNQIEKQNKSIKYRSISDSQQLQEKKSSDPQNSKSQTMKKRKNKKITFRQEMNQLEQQLQKSQNKSDPIKENVKFSDKAPSIIYFQDSQDQNVRYAAPISIVSGENKSESSKKCTINKTQVLILSHNKRLPAIGQQTLKTLPYSLCLNQQPPISYRKISQNQQAQKPKQRFVRNKLNLQQM